MKLNYFLPHLTTFNKEKQTLKFFQVFSFLNRESIFTPKVSHSGKSYTHCIAFLHCKNNIIKVIKISQLINKNIDRTESIDTKSSYK